MALYEFECKTCGIQYMVQREMGDNVPPVCCNVSMSRVYSTPKPIFKGTGWASKE